MKKILTIGAVALMSFAMLEQASAQSQSTALSLATLGDARGSARYQALSGAMGAMGVDFSSIHQNPAGIALFRSGGKISATLNHQSNSSKNTWYGNESKVNGRSGFNFDELSYMTNLNMGGSSNITLAFGFQSNGRVNRSVDAFTGLTDGLGASIANYAAHITNGSNLSAAKPEGLNAGAYSSAWENPWLSTLAYTTKWIDARIENDPRKPGATYYHYYSLYGNNPLGASLLTDERAWNSNFDLAMGFTLSPSFSLGFVASLSNLTYEYKTAYKEEFGRATGGKEYSLSLDSETNYSAMGARLGLGLLYQPSDYLRLGASVYTPQFLSTKMSNKYRATGVERNTSPQAGRDEAGSPLSETSFLLVTPWRFGLNAAAIFDRTAILSADYEYQNIGSTRLKPSLEDDYEYGYQRSEQLYKQENEAISQDFGGQHTIRLGLEVNASKRLALRGGFRYTTAPAYTADLKKNPNEVEMLVPSASVHYRLPGAIESYSLGLGYRLSPKWTLDVAYVLRGQNDQIATFPYIKSVVDGERAIPMKLIADKQVQSNISATISCRF